MIDDLKYITEYSIFRMQNLFHGEPRFKNLDKNNLSRYINQDTPVEVSRQLTPNRVEQLKELKHQLEEKNKPDENLSIWLAKRKLPAELINHPEFINFIKETKIYSNMRYFDHSIEFKTASNGIKQPVLLVNGKYLSIEELKNKFEITQNNEVIERETQEKWYYLQNGLVKHDPQTSIKPMMILPEDERHATPEIKFIAIEDRHIFVQLIKTNGEVYSLGALSEGGVRCPDPYEFSRRPSDTTTVEFNTSNEAIDEALLFARDRQARKAPFDFVIDNCSIFASEVGSICGLEAAAMEKIESHNTLKHKIKFYVASKRLAEKIKDPEQARAIQANKEEYIRAIKGQLMTQLIDDLNEGRSNKAAILATLNQTAYDEIISRMITQIVSEAQKENQDTLTEKIYNLFHDVFDLTKEGVIAHPNTLIKNLKVMKTELELDDLSKKLQALVKPTI